MNAEHERLKEILDLASQAPSLTLDAQPDGIHALFFSSDGQTLVTARKERVAVWKAHNYIVSAMAFMPDGSKLVTVSHDNKARLWDLASRRELVSFSPMLNSYWSVAISPDGQRITAGTFDGLIKVWDSATGQELVTLRGPDDWLAPNLPGNWRRVLQLAFLPPDGNTLISATPHEVRLWQAPSWAEIEATEKRAEVKAP